MDKIIEQVRAFIILRKTQQMHAGARFALEDWKSNSMAHLKFCTTKLEVESYRHAMRSLLAKHVAEHRKYNRTTQQRHGYAAHSA